MKAQLLVEFETGQIICTAVEKGKTHDFKLLKRSRLPFVRRSCAWPTVVIKALPNSTLKLASQQRSRANNHYQRLTSNTIARWHGCGYGPLHIIRRFKIFLIFSGRYRNRRKRFGLRLNLIAGLLNYELAHAH